MFVSETSIFNPSAIRIRISSLEGVDTLIEVTPDTSVDRLKIGAVSQIYDQREGYKLSLYYRLLHVASGQVLNEESTVLDAGIKDNDELLLLKKRVMPTAVPLSSAVVKDPSEKPPSADEIENATADVEPRHVNGQAAKPTSTVEFQRELRKILVSLIDIAQKLLCLNPDSMKDAAKFLPLERKKGEVREKSPPVSEKALKVLMSMGFDKNRATKALRINKMSETSAIQWLIDNPSEETATTEAEAPEAEAPVALDAQVADDVAKEKSAEESKQYLRKELLELAKLSGPEKVKRMLLTFQSNKRQEFKPDSSVMQNLLEMGFEEDDVIDAMRNHGNRQEEACEWLLSRGDSPPSEPDVSEGLDVNGAVYKAILSNHIIQLALSNPKTLIALLQILENPNTMQHWLQDAELSPMLLQVSRIYHSEKYSQ